ASAFALVLPALPSLRGNGASRTCAFLSGVEPVVVERLSGDSCIHELIEAHEAPHREVSFGEPQYSGFVGAEALELLLEALHGEALHVAKSSHANSPRPRDPKR